MRVFLFTTVFAPRIGGIERLSEMLAREWTAAGHEVVVATPTPGPTDGYPFRVVRGGSPSVFARWGRWCDVHLQMNVSLKFTPLGVVFSSRRRAFISHQTGYDVSPYSYKVLKKALARRLNGIACSSFIAAGLGGCVVIGNPFDETVFCNEIRWDARPLDCAFVGRTVSDKGCDTLLLALAELRNRGLRPTLTIIGDGEERPRLETMVRQLDLCRQVRFTGALAPPAIAEELNRHRFLVVPSRWEEPFGIVALEGLACGCVPVVARRGGLPEAIGPHGYTFENGDIRELAGVLEHVLRRPKEAVARLAGVEHHLAEHTARRVAEKYLEVFRSVVERK